MDDLPAFGLAEVFCLAGTSPLRRAIRVRETSRAPCHKYGAVFLRSECPGFMPLVTPRGFVVGGVSPCKHIGPHEMT
jgi:hypothetical protein